MEEFLAPQAKRKFWGFGVSQTGSKVPNGAPKCIAGVVFEPSNLKKIQPAAGCLSTQRHPCHPVANHEAWSATFPTVPGLCRVISPMEFSLKLKTLVKKPSHRGKVVFVGGTGAPVVPVFFSAYVTVFFFQRKTRIFCQI